MDVLTVAGIILGVNALLGALSKLIYTIKPNNEVSNFIDRALVFFKKLVDILASNVSHEDKK